MTSALGDRFKDNTKKYRTLSLVFAILFFVLGVTIFIWFSKSINHHDVNIAALI